MKPDSLKPGGDAHCTPESLDFLNRLSLDLAREHVWAAIELWLLRN
jgi:hypothetical protein